MTNRARTPTSSAPHVAPCPPPSLTAALPLEGIDPRPGREGALLQLQVDHAPPRTRRQVSEEVTISDAPHVHVVQQRHDAKAQPHTRGEEPAELNHPLQGEQDALGLSRCPDRLEDEDGLVEPASPGACIGSGRSSGAPPTLRERSAGCWCRRPRRRTPPRHPQRRRPPRSAPPSTSSLTSEQYYLCRVVRNL